MVPRTASQVGSRSTNSAVPFPVLIVVGNYHGHEHGGAFAEAVWNGVVQGAQESAAKYPRSTEADPIIPDEAAFAQIRERAGPFAWRRRALRRVPVPVRLSDGGDAGEEPFRTNLRVLLRSCDVWEIIAAGDADNTEIVRTALEGIDIPLLVLTDSTVSRSKAAHRPPELQYGPKNDRQAEALAWWIQETLGSGSPGVIRLLKDDSVRPGSYVEDLKDQLVREVQRRSEWKLEVSSALTDTLEPLIVVGYSQWALRYEERLLRYQGSVVFSDGCWSNEVLSMAKRNPEKRWYWARPDVDFTNLGRYVFLACVDAGRQLRDARTAEARRAIRPLPFTEVIRQQSPQHRLSPRYETELIVSARQLPGQINIRPAP